MRWKITLLVGSFAVAATLLFLTYAATSRYEFVPIGGPSNACECTKRIERTENGWPSIARIWEQNNSHSGLATHRQDR